MFEPSLVWVNSCIGETDILLEKCAPYTRLDKNFYRPGANLKGLWLGYAINV